MHKRRFTLGFILLLGVAVLATACGGASAEDLAAAQDRIEELEAELEAAGAEVPEPVAEEEPMEEEAPAGRCAPTSADEDGSLAGYRPSSQSLYLCW